MIFRLSRHTLTWMNASPFFRDAPRQNAYVLLVTYVGKDLFFKNK